MTETTKTTKERDFAARLADAGGEAMQKLTDLPMGKALVDGAQQLRERLDELGTRIRAIDPLEKRVTALEERLAQLEKKSKPAARRKPAAKKPAAKKTTAESTTAESTTAET